MPAKNHKRRVKADIFARDGGTCFYCERLLSLAYGDGGLLYPDSATIDHLVERRKGGALHVDNLVLACQNCNNKRDKFGMSAGQFLLWRKRHPERMLPARGDP